MLHSSLKAALLALGLVAFTASTALAQPAPLRTAVDPVAAPFAMTRLSGGLEGFSIDLLAAIGTQLGRRIDVAAMQYSGVFPAMQAGNIDFVGAPVTATPLRAESMIFTEGFLNTDYQFVTAASAPLETLESYRGKTISVNKGAAYDAWARAQASTTGWIVESYGTTNDAIAAVISGRSAAALTNTTEVAWAVKKNPRLRPGYRHATGEVFSMAFRKDSVALRNEVEGALECLKARGEVAKLYEKWFGVAPAAGSVATTVEPGYGVAGLPGHDAAPHPANCKK
jgi:polar amino acid transport system substrate-binding protein